MNKKDKKVNELFEKVINSSNKGKEKPKFQLRVTSEDVREKVESLVNESCKSNKSIFDVVENYRNQFFEEVKSKCEKVVEYKMNFEEDLAEEVLDNINDDKNIHQEVLDILNLIVTVKTFCQINNIVISESNNNTFLDLSLLNISVTNEFFPLFEKTVGENKVQVYTKAGLTANSYERYKSRNKNLNLQVTNSLITNFDGNGLKKFELFLTSLSEYSNN